MFLSLRVKACILLFYIISLTRKQRVINGDQVFQNFLIKILGNSLFLVRFRSQFLMVAFIMKSLFSVLYSHQ